MALPTNQFPYSSVVHVQTTIGGSAFMGSGVLIAPDEVLTAAHMVWTTGVGAATSVRVSPGQTGSSFPFGTVTATNWHYNPINDAGGLISHTYSGQDFALIHLSQPIGDRTGWMDIAANSSGGVVHVTGYPRNTLNDGQTMVDISVDAKQDAIYNMLDFDSQGIVDHGSSGGPLWFTDSQTQRPTVIGVVSAGNAATHSEFAARIDTVAYDEIMGWEAEDHGTAPPPPSAPHSVTGSLSVGASIGGTLSGKGGQWYSVSLTGGQSYIIDERGAASGGGTLRDPYLHLRDSGGHILAEDDDAGVGLDARLVWTAPASGDYYLDADSFLGIGSGTYQLSLARSGAAPTSTTPALDLRMSVFDATTNSFFSDTAQLYSGPLAGLRAQYAYTGTHNVAFSASTASEWLKGGPGNDAIAGGAGQNIIDGGGGSNYLTGNQGGTGTASFVIDARIGRETWNTISDFHSGDTVVIWGFRSTDRWSWDAGSAGAAGHQGSTLRASVGTTPVAVTFEGWAPSQQASLHLVGGAVGDTPYLMIS